MGTFPTHIRGIETDFGYVALSTDSRKYLESISYEWHRLAYRTKPYKTPKKEKTRRAVTEFITAINVLAKARFTIGGSLPRL